MGAVAQLRCLAWLLFLSGLACAPAPSSDAGGGQRVLIRASGGTLSAEDLTLTFPACAYATDTEVTLTRLADRPPGFGAQGPSFQLSASGGQPACPISVELRVPEDAQGSVVFLSYENATGFERLPSTRAPGVVRSSLPRLGTLHAADGLRYPVEGDPSCARARLHQGATTAPSGVALLLSVGDCHGRPVRGVPADEFLVAENGAVLRNEGESRVAEVTSDAFFLTFVFDVSRRALPALPAAVEGAKSLLAALPVVQGRALYVGVSLIEGTREIIDWQAPTRDLGRVVVQLEAIASGYQPADPDARNLNAGLLQALSRNDDAQSAYIERNLGGARPLGAVLAFVAGADTAGFLDEAAAADARRARSSQALGIALALDDANRNRLAPLFDGEVHVASTAEDLAFEYLSLLPRLEAMSASVYRYGYCSPKRAGEHEVAIEVSGEPSPSSRTYAFAADGFQGGCDPAFVTEACERYACGGLACGACDELSAACVVDDQGSQCRPFCQEGTFYCGALVALGPTGYPLDCSDVFIDGGAGLCCPPGRVNDGSGSCVAPGECIEGFHDGGDGACVPMGTCSAAYRLIEESCIAEGFCLNGNRQQDDQDCDGVLSVDDCDDQDSGSTYLAIDRDCDGILVADDCDDEDPGSTARTQDADCDGLTAEVDCDDSVAGSTSTLEDADCDGTVAPLDCDDQNPQSTIREDDGDCDGYLRADDCNDGNARSTYRAIDADCDGVIAADDCDDLDPASTRIAIDQDCDGYTVDFDCDDDNPDSTSRQFDADCDGVRALLDCNDRDPNSTIRALDWDCDGVVSEFDCDDLRADLGDVSLDQDCDGYLSQNDCNDRSAESTIRQNDADCDGVVTQDDCDDEDPQSTVIAEDADCDGVVTQEDCDDSDPENLRPLRGTMCFVPLSGGQFAMGSPITESGREPDEVLHRVTISSDLWVGMTEVTQALWENVTGENPSYHVSCGGECPVEQVDWYAALAFANEISRAEGLEVCYTLSPQSCADTVSDWAGGDTSCTGATFVGLDCGGYRLPTESEWEYVYRAGTSSAYYSGANGVVGACDLDGELDSVGWYCGNSTGANPVARKQPNDFDVYDLAGNVWEWVWDWYGTYPPDSVDPVGPNLGNNRVMRGGSWFNYPDDARGANRGSIYPSYFDFTIGFRVVRTAP